MDFDEAIKAHSAWKLKLSGYLRNPDGSIKAGDVQVDNKCALGQWIYADGTKFSGFPEYASLKKEHARFHCAAAEVVRKADTGAPVADEIAIGSKSEFGQASGAVVQAIMAIRRKSEIS